MFFKLAKAVKFEEQHARHVAYLALRLFDSAKNADLHSLSEKDRQLLYFAGILHDVGISLAFTCHDEHGYYIVKNYAGLLGFTDDAQTELALLVWSHRMRENVLLDGEHNIRQDRKNDLAVLAAFLKIAESLDRSHDQLAEDVFFERVGEGVRLCVISSVPECVEQSKLSEGLPLLRCTLPLLNNFIWKNKLL